MKKMLIAIDNDEIYNKFKDVDEYDVYNRDIVYKEGVLEYMSKNNVDILITRDDLEGNMIREIYIKQIRLLNSKVRIILFTKELDTKYLEFLYNNGIFDVIDSCDNFDFTKLIKMLDDNTKSSVLPSMSNNIKENNVPALNIVTKKKIAVFGTNGSGKSYVSTLLADVISENLNMNTLLMDMDVQSSAIDIYNNLNCGNNLLMDIVKDINNNMISPENFYNNVYKKGKKYFITNNASIFDYQNNLCVKQYEKIFEIASQKFDVIISDTPGNILLDISYYNIKNADVIMFVINPNYISIRQALKYLELITNAWNIDKSKINIIVNKVTKNSLSTSQIESLLLGYKVSMEIDYDEEVENIINGISKINENAIKEDREIYKIFGIEKETSKKENRYNFIYNFFKKGEKV